MEDAEEPPQEPPQEWSWISPPTLLAVLLGVTLLKGNLLLPGSMAQRRASPAAKMALAALVQTGFYGAMTQQLGYQRYAGQGLHEPALLALGVLATEVALHNAFLQDVDGAFGLAFRRAVDCLSGGRLLAVMAFSSALQGRHFTRVSWAGGAMVALGTLSHVRLQLGARLPVAAWMLATGASLLMGAALVGKESLLKGDANAGSSSTEVATIPAVCLMGSAAQMAAVIASGSLWKLGELQWRPLVSGAYVVIEATQRVFLALSLLLCSAPAVQLLQVLALLLTSVLSGTFGSGSLFSWLALGLSLGGAALFMEGVAPWFRHAAAWAQEVWASLSASVAKVAFGRSAEEKMEWTSTTKEAEADKVPLAAREDVGPSASQADLKLQALKEQQQLLRERVQRALRVKASQQNERGEGEAPSEAIEASVNPAAPRGFAAVMGAVRGGVSTLREMLPKK